MLRSRWKQWLSLREIGGGDEGKERIFFGRNHLKSLDSEKQKTVVSFSRAFGPFRQFSTGANVLA
jgi:hypothetical protein